MGRHHRIRAVIADDHFTIREGLAAILNSQPDMTVVGQGHDWPSAAAQILRFHPDVALIGSSILAGESRERIFFLCKRCSRVRIVLLGSHDAAEEVYESLQAGVRGFIPNSQFGREDLLACIRSVQSGQVWIHPSAAAKLAERISAPTLTKREKDLLKLVVIGKSNKEIGASLHVTEGTVKAHLTRIFAKLGATNRVGLVGIAVQRGLATLDTREQTPARK